jgi:high affinity sulfate transporter 1
VLRNVVNYKPEWLSKDLAAGLSIAAIALPIGIANAGIIGLPPEAGLYATILPMAVFAFFGSTKKLIVGPDSATSMMIATALLPFAALGFEAHYNACLLLSLLTGLFCILGGIFRLGFIANFLSKPILTGYLNGVALSVIVSMLGKVFGYETISGGFFRVAIDFLRRLPETHVLTVILGLGAVLLLLVLKRVSPNLPSPLIVLIGGTAAVYFFGLMNSGVQVIGNVRGGMLPLGIPPINLNGVTQLTSGALSIALISYCSGMLSNKSAAIKYGYELDANRAFIGFGASNLASGISGGFVVTGSDSRTAIAASLGKTSLTPVIASGALLMVLFFFTSPMAYLPSAVTAAIIIIAVSDVFDFSYIKKLYRINKREFLISIITSLAVMTIGILEGVLISVGLSLLSLLQRTSKPKDEILGKMENLNVYNSISEYENAKTIPGLLIYKYNAALVFFNSDYFRNRIRTLIDESERKPDWVLIDASSINHIDTTSNDVVENLVDELESKGIRLAFARTQKEVADMFEKSGTAEKIGKEFFFLTVGAGVEAYMKSKK